MTVVRIRRGGFAPPGPAISNLSTSARHQVVASWFKVASLVEFEDVLFRTNSAVVMPAGETPAPVDASGRQRTLVGIAATCLRRAEERPSEVVLVAGHTDTAGSNAVNDELSRYRAECVTAVLAGDSARFAEICGTWKRMRVSDYKQILKWVAETRGWECDPGVINDSHTGTTSTALNNFRRAYNEQGPGASWAPKVPLWGEATQRETWVAYFNMYEEALAAELGVDLGGVAALRAGLRFLSPERFVGCGEHHPLEAENVDEYRSQTNRRVEVLFFEPGEEPSLACHAADGPCDPAACELYSREKFRRTVIPPMLSALPWFARWSEAVAHADEIRQCVLEAPGLPDGQEIAFEVTQVGHGVIGNGTAVSQGERAVLDWSEWEHPASYQFRPDLSPGDPFAEVRFTFVAEGAGRRIENREPLLYADRVHMQLVLEDDTPIGEHPYRIISPWGSRTGRTDAQGVLDEQGLPPGGASIVLRERTLVHMGRLEPGWHEEVG